MSDDRLLDEEEDRVYALYHSLIDEVVLGENTIDIERAKPAKDQNVDYMLGQIKLNTALGIAIRALEDSGLIELTEDGFCARCEDDRKKGREPAVETKTIVADDKGTPDKKLN